MLPFPLFLLTLLASPAAAAPHDPIIIEGDAMLLAPDGVFGNGVRRGTGTPSDPWRISGWEIQAEPGGAAVSISNVRGHVVLENLTLRTAGGDRAHAIRVLNSANVRVLSVVSEGEGSFGLFRGSNVTVADARMENVGHYACLTAANSQLRMHRVEAVGLCGPQIVDLGATSFEGAHLRFLGVAGGFRVSDGDGARFTLVDANITASLPGDLPGAPDLAVGALGLDFQIVGPIQVRVSRTSVEGFRDACIRASAEGDSAATYHFADLNLTKCGDEVPHAAIHLFRIGAARVRAEGLTVRDSAVGIDAFDARAVVRGSRFVGNQIAVQVNQAPGAPAPTRIEVVDSVFSANVRHARAEAPGQIVLSGTWWPEDCSPADRASCRPFEGPVVVVNRAAQPPLPMPTLSTKATPALGAAAVLLTLFALAIPRR